MDNSIYFNNIKNNYDSLSDMFIKNNVLCYQNYSLPLTCDLRIFNPNLFLLNPEDIINIIYIYQLIQKKDLTEIEKNSLVKYAQIYFEIKNDSNKVNEQFGFSIPIYMAYDESCENNLGAIILKDEYTKLCENNEKMDSSKNAQYVRVLKNNNLPSQSEYDDYLEFHEKVNQIQNAGFVTIFLILFAISTTLITLLVLVKRGFI